MSMSSVPDIKPAPLDQIRKAREIVQDFCIKTPLLRLNVEIPGCDIFLKAENLQLIGSFKARPAANIIMNLPEQEREQGVFTASSGNFGIGVAWTAARLGIRADIVVPDNAPEAKLEQLRNLNATIHQVPYEQWWDVITTHVFPGITGRFIDAVGDPLAIAGNGTIGLEIMEQLPGVDTILLPFGGGGLAIGVASAVKAIKPAVRIIACESEAAQPLTAAFKQGEITEVPHKPSFISGMGVGSVLPWMWPAAKELINHTAVVSLADTAAAIRLLAQRNCLVAEGAGAVPVAAAVSGNGGAGNIVCVVSGGNIDNRDLITILNGNVPGNDQTR